MFMGAVWRRGIRWNSKVAENEGMSEPELEKNQKKKLSGIFFRSQIFFVHDFFFRAKNIF